MQHIASTQFLSTSLSRRCLPVWSTPPVKSDTPPPSCSRFFQRGKGVKIFRGKTGQHISTIWVVQAHQHERQNYVCEWKNKMLQLREGQLKFTTFTGSSAEVLGPGHKQAMASLINNVRRSRFSSAGPHVTFWTARIACIPFTMKILNSCLILCVLILNSHL